MPQRPANRVLLIGWDAADWQIIRPLVERGGMPNFKRFLDDGSWGNIATLNPILSPILWNSIATGKRADKHDILGFMEPDGQGFVRPVSSTSRKAKAIWNICSQNDLRSVVVGWFASYPAEQVNGAIVTDRYESFTGEPDKFINDANSFHPAAHEDALRDLHMCKEDFIAEQIRAFIPEVDSIDTGRDPRVGIFAHMLAQCASVHNASTYLLEEEAWDFAAVYYTAIDHFGHAFQEYHPPKMDHVTEEDFRLYSQVISSVYQYHDMMLGRLLELAGPDTTVLLLSDHGFKNGPDRPKIFVDPNTGHRTGPGATPVPWHRDFGVLAAMGPGIAKGREVRGATLLDICPTVLTLLGLPVGEDMDGKVIEPLFAKPPVIGRIPSYDAPHAKDGVHRGEHVEDPYAAQEVLKQLAELGYVENPGEDKELAVRRTIRDRKDALATVYFSAGRLGEAASVLRELFNEYDEPYYRYRLCNVLAALGRYDEFEALVDGAPASAEEAPLLNMLRAKRMLAVDQTEEAIELFGRILATTPGMPRIRSLLARPLIRHERFDQAEEVLREALEINPDDTEALGLLGLALRGQGQHEAAIECFMRSVTLNHDQPVVHVNLGVTLTMLEQWDWAIRAFQVALELRPGNPLPHRYLAKIYRDIKKDTPTAERHNEAFKAAKAGSRELNYAHQLDYDHW